MIYDREAIAKHEAGHCAGLIMGGRVPKHVSCDWPEAGALGLTTLDFSEDGVSPETAPSFVVSILLGPLAADQPRWPPRWPLDQDANDRDARQLAILSSHMQLDEDDWDSLVEQARYIASGPVFKRIVSLIASTLVKVDELDGEQIRFLIGVETCRTYGIEPVKEVAHAA